MRSLNSAAAALLALSVAVMPGCMWVHTAPAIPLKQATVEQLTALLDERAGTIQTMKGLFRAQVAGTGLLIAQRADGVVYYRRPDALRLQGFSAVGSKLFEYSQHRAQFQLEVPSEKKRYAGPVEELRQAKIGRLLQLSRWAVDGMVGNDRTLAGLRTALAEVGDRYRLDVFQAAPGSRLLRRLWFERHALYIVQEDWIRETGEVEASMTFDDFRVIPRTRGEVGVETVMPFRVTVTDYLAAGSVALSFQEIVVNPVLKPDELAAERTWGADEAAGG